jgi:putative ABC transport system permease protein
MFQDLWFGLRMLLKNRNFTLIAALTLALGIGANTAVFSVAYATLLRPLPFRDQERLVVAWKSDETTKHPFVEISIPEFNDWRSQNRVFDHLAAMTTSIYQKPPQVSGNTPSIPDRVGWRYAAVRVHPAAGYIA